ncbi:phosphate ABC transporter permease subunit PstC [Clostridium saccharobutylicum]|uniref:Phosphate transport system permease protein n=1 Tax=Clostridium saccharobutylicum DSM 13864 TaxID=1345695 RepID=U5MP99_CLOSA|nr:phosphate ABC transporter permease subunit PstC [Clostridium saccharobutylicum]AGX42353.1 ABC transporter permease protein YqgH [Clostridium saccharobutylicum DSM 13864]AQR89634.1 phosphate transport system permease protein PstC [Clostridium saccharobutylicum]AQR99536.1 phosphate transport system permease protein PstC [Clostridium saccharobutylicum]AQS09267.1 phosphate transport system permease protein PstC [Clostridium saccharobutylicum]AQS13522.1 phosphate transport system permease protei
MEKRSLKERLKNEYLGQGFAALCGILIILITIAIIVFIASKGIRIFVNDGYSVSEFLFKNNWNPNKGAVPSFGALAFILGSTLVSIGAVIISAPIAIALAIFVNVISSKFGKKIIKPSLEILVGIPSVVYGWVGISILVPFIKGNFGGMGFSLLAGVLVLAIMILPTIATLSIDAIKTIPESHIEASYGLGATRWQTISRVIIPGAKSGILTGVVLGIARAFGEALAVQMVIGNTVKIPDSIFSSMATLTSIITMDMANTVGGTAWNDALWTLALILLVISFIFILIVRMIERRSEV